MKLHHLSAVPLLIVGLAACGSVANSADTSSVDAAAEVSADTNTAAPIGPTGGTVNLLHFAVFGDVRPQNADEVAGYPTSIVTQVFDGIASFTPQFVIGSGDYMFATTATSANAQLDLFLQAEGRYSGYVFHALGNHECTGATAGNCPLYNETPNIQAYFQRLAHDFTVPYFDFTVQTSMGAAHFIVTAPNAWGLAEQSWLTRALAQQARYTILVAHEPPTTTGGPGSMAIESLAMPRAGGLTLRLYGHTHEYSQIGANALISGNAGAPLSSTRGTYGFVVVDQRADGALAVTEYSVGTPPTALDSWAVNADGTAAP